MFKRALTVKHPHFRDLRGDHIKLFGAKPEWLEVPDYTIHEVFMTVSHQNVMRGMHIQVDNPQPKIIKAIDGRLRVAMVNCDINSDTLGEVVYSEITPDDEVQLYVPGNWALGYQAMEETNKVLYLAGADFAPDDNGGFNIFSDIFDDYWTITPEEAIMSDGDRGLPVFEDFVKLLEEKKEPTLW